jgi:hypothetical protein
MGSAGVSPVEAAVEVLAAAGGFGQAVAGVPPGTVIHFDPR